MKKTNVLTILLALCIMCVGCNVNFNRLEEANEIRDMTNKIIYKIKNDPQIRNTLFVIRVKNIVNEQQNEDVIRDKTKAVPTLQRRILTTDLQTSGNQGASNRLKRSITGDVS